MVDISSHVVGVGVVSNFTPNDVLLSVGDNLHSASAVCGRPIDIVDIHNVVVRELRTPVRRGVGVARPFNHACFAIFVGELNVVGSLQGRG